MVKLRLINVIVVLILSVTPVFCNYGAELLRNNKFTFPGDGKIAEGWFDASWGLNVKPEFKVVRLNERVGLGQNISSQISFNAQQIKVSEVPQGKWMAIAQEFETLKPGLYKFQARLKADSEIPIDVQIRLAPAPYTSYGRKSVTLKPDIWTDVVGFAKILVVQNRVWHMILQHKAGTLLVSETGFEEVKLAQLSDSEKREVERLYGPPIAPVDENVLLAETDSRILKNRTAPLTVEVRDKSGRPVANEPVQVEHKKHLFYFGAGFDRELLKTNMNKVDLRHRDAFLRLFNYSTVHIYWGGYEPRQGAYNSELVLRSIRWLKEHGITPRGHPIHWNHRASVPKWVVDMNPDTEKMRELLNVRVKQLSETVLPELHDADVFNELVHWERFDNPFTRLINESGKVKYVTEMLKEVKKLNPRLLTVVNDYDTSPQYYALLKELIEAGAPIDYIGQQSHMHGGNWSMTQLWTILERLSLLKRPVLFTELSVLSAPRRHIDWKTERPLEGWETDPEYEKIQADYLENFYKVAYSHSNCIGIVVWNYSDRRAWLGAPVGFLRKDGSPKPSFKRLDNLINKKWRTSGTFTTDAQGKLVINDAFEGEYLIKAGKTEVKGQHSPKNPLKLTLQKD